MGRKLEEEVARQRAENTEANLPRGGNLPDREKGDTRDVVGHAVGMGGSTYQHAKSEPLPGDQVGEEFRGRGDGQLKGGWGWGITLPPPTRLGIRCDGQFLKRSGSLVRHP